MIASTAQCLSWGRPCARRLAGRSRNHDSSSSISPTSVAMVPTHLVVGPSMPSPRSTSHMGEACGR